MELDFSAVFDAINQPYLILSPDLIIMGANRAYLRATLTEGKAILGRHLFEAFPDNPADATADGVHNLSASLGRVLARRLPDAMPIQRYDIRRPDGIFEARFWDPLNIPVLRDGDEISAILHHVTDVTRIVQWRSPHSLSAQLERPVRADELPGILAAAANEAEQADKAIKRTKNGIAEVARDVEQSQAIITASQRRLKQVEITMES